MLLAVALLGCAPDGSPPERLPVAAGLQETELGSSQAGKELDIALTPGSTRFVHIRHKPWQKRWAIQLPETIASREYVFMSKGRLKTEWKQRGANSWYYLWRPSPEHLAKIERQGYSAATGLKMEAAIEAIPDGIRLTLTATNESSSTIDDLHSEGGCLQARSALFRGPDEVEHRFVMVNGKMTSMAELGRTDPLRCHYMTAFKRSKLDAVSEFWGTSPTTVDAPVIIGAKAQNRRRALVLGYQDSWSGLQNAGQPHCIHSNPYFGDLAPGDSVTRTGFILFGKDLDKLAERLLRRLKKMPGALPGGPS